MKQQYATMGMLATVTIVDLQAKEPIRQAQGEKDIQEIFSYFDHIDQIFSTYKSTSEISLINDKEITRENASKEVAEVLLLCDKTKEETHGYFDMERRDKIDPSGIVKGYAIHQAAQQLRKKGYKNFSVEIAGDVEVIGLNEEKNLWRIGIQNPFSLQEIVKVIGISDKGVATSGNYIRGQHIYNPITKESADAIASMTVIGPNVYEADRFATAAFAMGEKGIEFIETLPDCEGYMITKDKKAIYTSGFEKFILQ